MKRAAVLSALTCALLLVTGCAKKDDLLDADWIKETQAGQAPWREVESLFSNQKADSKDARHALRGVSHDLKLNPQAAPSARCTCLDVAVGPATEPRFRWTGDPPLLAPDQLAVAMRTEGSNCPAPESQPRRPSIYAVDQIEGDTIIVVEELPADRPQALGAIIPMPAPGRSLYVRARSDRTQVAIYAQGPKGPSSMCRVMTRDANVARNE
ncbi:MAG: hypothetical protein FJ096_11285 [Deltaproteobacteria bacterium]|nr:hypothetical protein [Deltaproteobacteria bacterium]